MNNLEFLYNVGKDRGIYFSLLSREKTDYTDPDDLIQKAFELEEYDRTCCSFFVFDLEEKIESDPDPILAQEMFEQGVAEGIFLSLDPFAEFTEV